MHRYQCSFGILIVCLQLIQFTNIMQLKELFLSYFYSIHCIPRVHFLKEFLGLRVSTMHASITIHFLRILSMHLLFFTNTASSYKINTCYSNYYNIYSKIKIVKMKYNPWINSIHHGFKLSGYEISKIRTQCKRSNEGKKMCFPVMITSEEDLYLSEACCGMGCVIQRNERERKERFERVGYWKK